MTFPLRYSVAVLVFSFLTSVTAGTVNGIYYESRGSGEPVVLIHGGQMDRRMWDFQFEEFAKQFRVIRYDIRGFGKSPLAQNPYSNAEDLRALLQKLRMKKATLIGLSLGAAIATEFAIQFPESVNSLVLICPGLGGFRFEDKANNLGAVVEAAQRNDVDKVAELWLKNPYMSVAMEQPRLQPRLTALARENVRCWLNNPLMNRRMIPPAAERLREIHAPTLVIGGSRDVSDIHKIVAKLSSEIPGARKEIVAGAGHLVPMETPEIFKRMTLDFLAGMKGR